MVRTGDQAVPRVSRQMAPWNMLEGINLTDSDTCRLTADIRVPQLCLEEHLRRSKWIFLGNLDVYNIGTAFIWRIWRTWERCM